MESIENGVSSLSYNVRHGPSEIIQNGINGYLIEKMILIVYQTYD